MSRSVARQARAAVQKLRALPTPGHPLKLDLGCGNEARKHESATGAKDFLGVDAYKRPGVDIVCNLSRAGWPWRASTVDEVWCSHTLEHIAALDRIVFFNELWRVMKVGAKATIITPHWASNRAYGDVTHQWPPVSEMFWFSLDPKWRKDNQPHLSEGSGNPATEFRCDFTATWGYQLASWLAGRTQEYIQNALNQYKEAAQDMICTLIKRDERVQPTLPTPAIVK